MMMNQHKIVSPDEWIAARKQLLDKEKELTHQIDQLNAERRMLPWVKVEKEYVFDTPDGKKSLADLFDGRSQLIVYHFMFSPAWKEGCVGCSFFSDHVDGAEMHIKHHDVSFVAISRAPLAALDAYKKRMGWRFNWLSSDGSDFNYDFHVSFTKDELARGEAYYNYEMTQRRNGRRVSHLFVLRPRGRARPWRIHVPRSYAQGPQRNRSQQESDGLGAAPRQVRGGTTVSRDCRFLGAPGDLLLRMRFYADQQASLGRGVRGLEFSAELVLVCRQYQSQRRDWRGGD
jgi:predicted dithiol-disulfide oxidoreductase (DUF899 family)